MIEAAAALARFDSSPWLGEVDVPTAVVLTEQDGHIPPRYQGLMADAIPGAEVHRVDADHYACVARPDLFVPTLFRACRSVALRGTPGSRRAGCGVLKPALRAGCRRGRRRTQFAATLPVGFARSALGAPTSSSAFWGSARGRRPRSFQL